MQREYAALYQAEVRDGSMRNAVHGSFRLAGRRCYSGIICRFRTQIGSSHFWKADGYKHSFFTVGWSGLLGFRRAFPCCNSDVLRGQFPSDDDCIDSPLVSSGKPMCDHRLLLPILCFLVSFSQLGCVQRPGYSAIRSDRFLDETLPVARIAIIASMDTVNIRTIGNPLVQNLASRLQNAGYAVQTETQIANPLALGPATDFRRARQFRPDAIMLIRVESGYSSTNGGDWNVSFNVLDGKGKGVWRGTTQVRHLREMDATYEALTRQVVEVLENGEIIKFSNQPVGLPI